MQAKLTKHCEAQAPVGHLLGRILKLFLEHVRGGLFKKSSKDKKKQAKDAQKTKLEDKTPSTSSGETQAYVAHGLHGFTGLAHLSAHIFRSYFPLMIQLKTTTLTRTTTDKPNVTKTPHRGPANW